MRTAFVTTMLDLAEKDPKILLLTADLGFSVLERFADAFPGRFINVGVAEANMIGLATGLALDGWKPYVYSIATFASMRGYEQARNGPVLHQLPVRIIGTGGGFAYGHAGITHFALEDFAIFRALPGMAVLSPADPAQTRSALLETAGHAGPVYFRIGKGDNPPVAGLEGRFRLSDIETVTEGKDALLLVTGAISPVGVAAAGELDRLGIHATVGVAATLSPAPNEAIASLAEDVPLVVTVEEHFATGGLGSMVAEALADLGQRPRLLRIAVNEMILGVGGSPDFLRLRAGLTRDHIVRKTLEALHCLIS